MTVCMQFKIRKKILNLLNLSQQYNNTSHGLKFVAMLAVKVFGGILCLITTLCKYSAKLTIFHLQHDLI